MMCCKFNKTNNAVVNMTGREQQEKSGRALWEYVPECKQPATRSLNSCSATESAILTRLNKIRR